MACTTDVHVKYSWLLLKSQETWVTGEQDIKYYSYISLFNDFLESLMLRHFSFNSLWFLSKLDVNIYSFLF